METSVNRNSSFSSKENLHKDKSAEYLPAAVEAQKNFAISNSQESLKSAVKGQTQRDDLIESQELNRQQIEDDFSNRLKHVFTIEYPRILGDLSTFIKLRVNIRHIGMTGSDSSIKDLAVVIDRNETVDKLCSQVEAEYAFFSIGQHKLNEKDNFESPEKLAPSFKLLILSDISNVTLNFDQTIQNVVNNGDQIIATGLLICGGRDEYVDNLIKFKTDALETFWLNRKDFLLNKTNFSLEAKTFHVLHHASGGLGLFQEFCLEEFEIEYLLAWLEIEVFRGLSKEVLALNNKGPDSVSIGMFDKNYSNLLLHARYIYFTFLAPFSKLRLNCRRDLLESVGWPFPQLDPITGLSQPLKLNMFDAVQEHVFLYLTYHVYPEFEKSSFYSNWCKEATNTSNVSLFIFPGTHHKKFLQDIDGMQNAVSDALNQFPQQEESRFKDSYQQTTSYASPSPHQSYHFSYALRSSVLGAAYGARNSIMQPFTDSFFGSGPKLTVAQKQRRIQRERKLKKFFGEIPTKSDPYEDATHAQFGVVTARDEKVEQHVDVSTKQEKAKSPLNYIPPPTVDETLQSRKKKVDKLEDFFGVQKIPVEQLFEQKLINELESISQSISSEQEDFIAPETRNQLTPKQRKRLLQKNKKLKELLGEQLDERLIAQSVVQVPHDKEEDAELDNEKFTQSLMDNSELASQDDLNIVAKPSSRASLVSISEKARQIILEKDRKRKKLEKIQQFLGEKISESIVANASAKNELNFSPSLSSKEKSAAHKRFNKLHSVFGEVPPNKSAVVISIDNEDETELTDDSNVISDIEMDHVQMKALADLVGGKAALGFLFSNEKNMTDLLKILDEFDKEEDQCNLLVKDSIKEEAEESVSKNGSPNSLHKNESLHKSSDEKEDLPSSPKQIVKQAKTERQKKSIKKLTKFFGETGGQISSEMNVSVNEVRMIKEITRHLKGVIINKE